VVHQPRFGRGYANYLPQALPVPSRHAAYAANLVLLAVCVGGEAHGGALFGVDVEVADAWKDEALLWRSQLGADGWDSLVETLALRRVWTEDGRRNVVLTFAGASDSVPPVDPFWTYGRAPNDPQRKGSFVSFGQHPDTLLRKAHFMCRVGEDLISHTLEPLAGTLGVAVNTVVGWGREPARTAANALLEVWLLPLGDAGPTEREAAYELCAKIATHGFPPWDDLTRVRYAKLLLGRLATDEAVPAALAADILNKFAVPELVGLPGVAQAIVRCVLAFIGIDPASDPDLVRVLDLTEGFSDAGRRAVFDEARGQLERLERFMASGDEGKGAA